MGKNLETIKDSTRLRGQSVFVVGAGRSGLAAVRLLTELGAYVTLVEEREELSDFASDTIHGLRPEPMIKTGAFDEDTFAGASLIVLSPGVAVRKIAHTLHGISPDEIISELELGTWFVDQPMAAITGTNGKTTTTMVLTEMLKTAGKKVFTGGNIGTPLCEYFLSDEPADVIVLETSSFQLQNCHTFAPDAALILNFAPDHMDYHEDMDEYLDAKLKIFENQKSDQLAVIPEKMADTFAGRKFTEAKIISYKAEGIFKAPHLHGVHNQENVEGAWLLAQYLGVTKADAAKAVYNFCPPAHRLENVGEKNSILFVDDSKATTLDAMEVAV